MNECKGRENRKFAVRLFPKREVYLYSYLNRTRTRMKPTEMLMCKGEKPTASTLYKGLYAAMDS